MPAKAWPTTCSGSSSAWGSGAPLLLTQRLCIWQPNPQHVAATSDFVDKAWEWLICIFLHQRDKLLHSFFVLKPLLHLLDLFLTLWSPGNFYDDYVFCLFTELF